MAIRDTIQLKSLCRDLEQKLTMVESAPKKIAQLKTMLNKLEGLIGKADSVESLNLRHRILSFTSEFCDRNRVVLREFNQPIVIDKHNYLIETNIVVLQGGFHNLLKFGYALEREYSLGKVVSVKYHIFRDFKKREDFLLATIYLQNIKKKDYENSGN